MKFLVLEESRSSNKFELGTAGYVEKDGTFTYMDEYHGEDREYRELGLPEFSNTHAEEDTCVRIFNEPNKEQYDKLEYIIDTYLDREEYCKVEINKDFYKVFSLREGACEDYTWGEVIGNWNGYNLIRVIKNYFKNKNNLDEFYPSDDLDESPLLSEKIVKKGNKWQVQSEKGRNMGTYDTEEKAKKRLRQIEYFKHMQK